jgi:hypothetical protein
VTPLPKWLSWPIVVLALWIAVWVAVASYGASRYRDGRRSVTTSAETVPASVTVARDADSTAKAKTDTVVKRITITRWQVETLLVAVPDSLRSIPQIKALIAATLVLTHQVDTLTHTLDVERATSRLRASVDSAALVSAQMTIVHQEDQIVQLKKRPQWRTVFAVGALGVVAGVLR